jgi:GTP:adenosylcobinamide-phosphate guanylyltransferase
LARVIDAVVLAGGPPDAVAALQPGTPNKAFVQIAGVSLVERVLSALHASASIERTIVVAPAATLDRADLALAGERRPDGRRITDSLRQGLAGLDPDRAVLIVTSDLPVLRPAAVDDFVARVRQVDADVAYGCVEKNAHLARYPKIPHTWARLRDGTFCGTGLMAIKPRALQPLEAFLERLGAARKSPLRLASLFGWDMLLAYALGRLSIASAEARGARLLGAPVRAVVSPYPEIAVNVDRPGDVQLACDAILAQQSAQGNAGMP